MLYRFLVILIFLVVAHAAQAGPWLREKGTTFSAVTFSSSYYLETGSQTYLEYGLNDKTTLIGDFGLARLQTGQNTGYVNASLRRAVSAPDARSKWAYELGLGAGWIEDTTLPHIRTALSWGKGITWAEKSGWITVDAAILWDLTQAAHVAKFDTTLGLNFTEVTSGMLQFYSLFTDHKNIATIAPSLIFTPKGRKFRIQVGSESEIGNFGNTALKVGLWREF